MANDTHQLVVAGHTAGEFWEMIMHFQNEETNGSDPLSSAVDLINAFDADMAPAFLAVMATDAEIIGYKAKRVNNGGSPYAMLSIVARPGTVTGTSATSAAAQLITSSFQRATKWFSGKIFIPSVPESALTGNTLSTGQLTLLDDVTTALSNLLAGDDHDWTYTIFSKVATAPFIPVYIQVSAKIGIQRRRLTPVL